MKRLKFGARFKLIFKAMFRHKEEFEIITFMAIISFQF